MPRLWRRQATPTSAPLSSWRTCTSRTHSSTSSSRLSAPRISAFFFCKMFPRHVSPPHFYFLFFFITPPPQFITPVPCPSSAPCTATHPRLGHISSKKEKNDSIWGATLTPNMRDGAGTKPSRSSSSQVTHTSEPTRPSTRGTKKKIQKYSM